MAKVLGATNRVINAIRKADKIEFKESELTHDVHNVPDETKVNISNQLFVPVRVVSGNGVIGYTCDIYEHGLSESPTKQGLVFLANGASTIYSLPTGTIMYAQLIEIQKLGSN